MSENQKKTPKWLEKLKKIKHIEIYIAIIFIVILLIIYISGVDKKSNSTDKNLGSSLTVTAYVEKIESNLEEILSNIGGVSNVKVMITLDLQGIEVTNSMLDLNSFPEIRGVIVTAKGVNNTQTKLKVLRAVEAVLDIKNGSIEILSSD